MTGDSETTQTTLQQDGMRIEADLDDIENIKSQQAAPAKKKKKKKKKKPVADQAQTADMTPEQLQLQAQLDADEEQRRLELE